MGCCQSSFVKQDAWPLDTIVYDESTLEGIYRKKIYRIRMRLEYIHHVQEDQELYGVLTDTAPEARPSFAVWHNRRQRFESELIEAHRLLLDLRNMGEGKFVLSHFKKTNFGQMLPSDLCHMIGKFVDETK